MCDSLLSFADVIVGFALTVWAFFTVESWLITRSEMQAEVDAMDNEVQNASSSDAL